MKENGKDLSLDQLRGYEDSNITLDWVDLLEGTANENVKEEAQDSS